jgi:transcriptional regulator with XRE-family HTH domain
MPPRDQAPIPKPATSPGAAIRSVRKRLGLTLSDVGRLTGMAISTLSKLEKGRASLSYDKLLRLSQALGVDMAQLLEPAVLHGEAARVHGRRVVQRRGEGMPVETPVYRQTYLATELLNKRFTPMIGELRARTLDEFFAEFGDFIRHPGEEFCLVLEGKVEFHSEAYAPVTLVPGDSVYFDSDMGHAYLAAGEGPCRMIVICAGASGQQLSRLFEKSPRPAKARSAPPARKAAARPASRRRRAIRR